MGDLSRQGMVLDFIFKTANGRTDDFPQMVHFPVKGNGPPLPIWSFPKDW